jgi:ATP-dependent exoDNAse (exonuclease V) beta subunit
MKFLVYKASAGSGKTFTLVREYLRMALEGSDPRRFRKILAITFTNKAATEMKERVISTLHEMAAPDREPAGSAAIMAKLLQNDLGIEEQVLRKKAALLLSNILHQYNDFSVGTIDSFMHRVVRTFAQDLHIPVNFTVELSNDVLIQLAVDELLEKIGSDTAVTDALIGYTLHLTDEEKTSRIEEELAKTAIDLLSEKHASAINALKHLKIGDFLQMRSDFSATCSAIQEELAHLGNQALDLLEAENLTAGDLYYSKSGIYKWFESLCKISGEVLPIPNSNVRKTLNNQIWYSNGKKDSYAKQAVDRIKPELNRIAQQAAEIIDAKSSDYTILSILCKDLFQIALLNEISRIIDRIRNEEGIVHISEFNKRVSKIVSEEPVPFIYERLGEKYQHFMIDEFQDTSVMQWQNLLPLIENGLAQSAGSLVVGDGKQAIYRFRGGEVGLFANLPEPYPENASPATKERYKLLKQLFELEDLDHNFRSGKSIIEFNNKLYQYISEKFLPSHLQSVYKGLQQHPGKDFTGYVQIEWLPPGLDLAERNEEHRVRTLAIINDLVNNRNFKHRDIAILVRSNKQGALMAEALVEEGLPVISGESLMVDASPDVLLILSCLQVLADRNRSLHLFNICNWLIRKGKLPFRSLEELVIGQHGLHEEKLLQILEREGYGLTQLRLGGTSLFELCHRIIEKFGINTVENPYVLFFLEAVWTRSGKSVTDCTVFLDWWAENRTKQCLKLPENADAIRILTIHKSKGLQFPVVIFPYAHSQRKNTTTEWVEKKSLLPGNLPAARINLTKNIAHTVFADLLRLEDDKATLDQINLLYVATTRPETALFIISGASGNKGSVSDGWEKYLLSFLEEKESEMLATGRVSWGDAAFRKADEEEKEKISKALLPKFKSSGWLSRLRISEQSAKAWQEESTAVIWGNLLHTALEGVRTVNDIDTSLRHLQQAGFIQENELQALAGKIREVLALPEISMCFTEGLTVKTERELLLPDGSVIRPDRVVLTGNTWVVLDYKTGKPEKKHHDQVKSYVDQLSSIKPFQAKGFLVYLHEPPRVVAVDTDSLNLT